MSEEQRTIFDVISDNDINEVSEFLYETPSTKTLLTEEGEDGLTPLMFAISYADKDIVELLLEVGADPNAIDRKGDGGNALYHPVFHNQIDVVNLLIKSGGDVRQEDFNGETLLELARWRGHKEMAQLLLDEVLRVGKRLVPFAWAEWKEQPDIASLLHKTKEGIPPYVGNKTPVFFNTI